MIYNDIKLDKLNDQENQNGTCFASLETLSRHTLRKFMNKLLHKFYYLYNLNRIFG